MPLRHLSSGDSTRQHAFLRALAWMTALFGVALSLFNTWLGDVALAASEFVLAMLAIAVLAALRRGIYIERAKWMFLLACLSVVLFALVNAPSASVFIWALLVLPVAHRVLGLRAGSIVSLVFLTLAGAVLIQRYDLPALLNDPRPIADVLCFALVLFFTSYLHERDLQKADRSLRERADVDSVTRLATRARFHELFEQARSDARRRRRGAFTNATMILIDLDHFKQINDRHGHAAGDVVLGMVSKRLLGGCRAEDLLGRVGGEELAVMLFGLSHDAALSQAERLRRSICDSPIEIDTTWVRITASLGVTTCELADTSFSELFKETDRRLYAAKAGGRNRIQSEPVT